MKYALTKRAHAQQTMAVGFTRECTGGHRGGSWVFLADEKPGDSWSHCLSAGICLFDAGNHSNTLKFGTMCA